MRFNMLGPLEVTSEGRPLVLGGAKQRAALGFLLLQPNQVVSTSQLLRALWSVEGAPTTARKILQNAVWGLRRALSVDGTREARTILKTQPPGYSLQVDRELIDHHYFLKWVSEGRSRLAAGAPEEAALLLRDALALWRGPALSDLVEAGVLWPELTTLQDARLGVQEDFFEAQLASGRHYSVLSDLEVMVDTEPLRERSCGQLMRTLYRCGRQADALGVYARLRATLVEDLGLEPSRELQLLQQAVLVHDPSLQLPESGSVTLAGTRPAPFTERPEAIAVTKPRTPSAPPESGIWERREASILLVRAELHPELEAEGSYDMAAAFDGMAGLVRQQIEQFGGVCAGAMGGVSLGLFLAEPHGDDHTERAVRAAVSIRGALADSLPPGAQEGIAVPGVVVRAGVATGQALVQGGSGDALPSSVNGALLHECQALLSLVSPGEVQVCERTRAATMDFFDFHPVPGPQDRWQVQHVISPGGGQTHNGGSLGHTGELDLLTGLLEHTRRWRRPHQATVLGVSEAARTRLFTELRERLGGNAPDAALVLSVDGIRPVEDGPYALHRMVLAAYCGLTEQDSPGEAWRKLDETIRKLAQEEDHADWLMAQLGPALASAAPRTRAPYTGAWRTACRQFIAAAAQQRPLVLISDVVHRVGDILREFMEDLARTGRPMPLLAVTGARPEVPQPVRGLTGAKHAVTMITLDGAADEDTRTSPFVPSRMRLALGTGGGF